MEKYPLEQLIFIKKNRFDQAVKLLEEKKALLKKAEEKLLLVQKERDEVLEHKKAKLEQLRQALDEGTTTDKIQQMKVYMKIVDEKLLVKQKAVDEQQKAVQLAQKQVELATQEMFQRKKDVEKLDMHKGEWTKEAAYEELRKETSEHDEQGAAGFEHRRKREKRK